MYHWSPLSDCPNERQGFTSARLYSLPYTLFGNLTNMEPLEAFTALRSLLVLLDVLCSRVPTFRNSTPCCSASQQCQSCNDPLECKHITFVFNLKSKIILWICSVSGPESMPIVLTYTRDTLLAASQSKSRFQYNRINFCVQLMQCSYKHAKITWRQNLCRVPIDALMHAWQPDASSTWPH